MTSDFMADECSHVELASRMAMGLCGAAPRAIDLHQFVIRPSGPTPFRRADELLLRVSCIAEAGPPATIGITILAEERAELLA